MFSRIFIEHPRLAFVVSIIIAFCGYLCCRTIPVAEYPEIVPTMITVSAKYAGASPEVVSDTVATPLEDEINAVDDLLYFDSICNETGSYSCYVTFKTGTDPNINLVNLQNAVKRAEPKLPAEVVQNGIKVKKRPEDRMAMYVFITDGSEMSLTDLGNFVEKEIADSVQRIDGVAEVECSDRQYAMRVWLNPVRLSGLGLSIFDVKQAIEQQNIQAAAGRIGNEFSSKYLSYKLNVKGRLKTAEEFENIVVRSNSATGGQVLLKDVARVEVGMKSYVTRSRFDDNLAFFMSVYKSPEANAITTSKKVKGLLDEWMQKLPKGVTCVLGDDTTAFTLVFLRETFRTLLAALVLVVVITYLFLQDWRATFVPAIAIPISLLGTFAFLAPLGFTLNILTMFGLILVIGSLVDDAIVVVENTQSLMLREGLSAKDAAIKSMRQISSAIIATSLVTLACYVPLIFYKGMVGKMYTQFAVTMCVALCLSTTVALTLSPALCSLLLKKPPERPPRIFAPFNFLVNCSRKGYLFFVRLLVRRTLITLILFAGIVLFLKYVSGFVPESFLPKEDRGYIQFNAELSEGSTLERTCDVIDRVHDLIADIPGVQSISSTSGSSYTGGVGENHGRALIRLEHWDNRHVPEKQIDVVMAEVRRRVESSIPEAKFTLMTPPAIRGLGGMGGVTIFLCSMGDITINQLSDTAQQLVRDVSEWPEVAQATCAFTAVTPQLFLDLDRRKAESLGVTAKTVFSTLQNKLASFYVNDFNMRGGTYQVVVQSDSDYRATTEDIMDIRFPGTGGAMVPLSAVGRLNYMVAPRFVKRYNKMPAAYIIIRPKSDVPSLEVMDKLEEYVKHLPSGYSLNWGAMSFQEKANRGQIVGLLAMAVFFAYLFLVAQYESWTVPVSVMLSVAVAVTGAMTGLWLTGTHMSIYAQLGLVMLIGLSAKNAILMVEFAKRERERGVPVVDAAMNGANLRFRAVMMTAWSFIFGVLPLVVASGAGANAQKAIGITTFSGMLAATFVGIIFVPALYAACQRMREFFVRRKGSGT